MIFAVIFNTYMICIVLMHLLRVKFAQFVWSVHTTLLLLSQTRHLLCPLTSLFIISIILSLSFLFTTIYELRHSPTDTQSASTLQ